MLNLLEVTCRVLLYMSRPALAPSTGTCDFIPSGKLDLGGARCEAPSSVRPEAALYASVDAVAVPSPPSGASCYVGGARRHAAQPPPQLSESVRSVA